MFIYNMIVGILIQDEIARVFIQNKQINVINFYTDTGYEIKLN